MSHLLKSGSSITYQYWTCELKDAIQPRRVTEQLVQGVMFNWTVVNVDTSSECEINAVASEFMSAGVFYIVGLGVFPVVWHCASSLFQSDIRSSLWVSSRSTAQALGQCIWSAVQQSEFRSDLTEASTLFHGGTCLWNKCTGNRWGSAIGGGVQKGWMVETKP